MSRSDQNIDSSNVVDIVSNNAALKIQTAVRGYLAKKNYKINPLEKIITEHVFCVGNDPIIQIPSKLKSDRQIVLVATSGLRVLDIAGQFCASNTTYTPKICIVDINTNVKLFWLGIKEKIFEKAKSIEDVIKNINDNQYQLCGLPSRFSPHHNSEISAIIEALKKYSLEFGFDRLKKMVANVVAITHDWTDPDLFLKLKNIFNKIGLNDVYIYPSNIITCIDAGRFDADPRINQMFKNIMILNPRVSIYSNIQPELGMPSLMICSSVVDPKFLAKYLGIKEIMYDLSKQKWKSRHFCEAFRWMFEILIMILVNSITVFFHNMCVFLQNVFHKIGQVSKYSLSVTIPIHMQAIRDQFTPRFFTNARYDQCGLMKKTDDERYSRYQVV